MEPKRFFEVALPNMVARSFMDFLQTQGRISFDIRGAGQWTFRFGTEEPVKKGLEPGSELRLTFTRRAFDAFVNGTLDTAEAVQRREVVAAGSAFELLEAFGRILRPPTVDLGWDAKSKG
ncbi:MAG: hypothetical protein IPJ65_03205 [Archangiaceae bacterium]|nr:hypothetical protein [Archangiaceae bacterium]